MRSTRRHCGFMLLEVVVAIGLLVLGMAVIGAQIQTSLWRTHQTDRLAREVFLAESKIAELDTGLIEPEQEIEEDFGRLFPAYAWRLTLEPTEAEELFFIQLEILYDPARDPEEDFDFEEAEVAQVFYTLRAAPRPLDLTVDFGMDEEVAEKLNEDLAGLGGGAIDVHDFNPAIFRDLDMEEILEVLPVFMQAFNIEQSAILTLVPAELRPQLEALFEEYQADDAGEESEEDGLEDSADGEGFYGPGGDRAREAEAEVDEASVKDRAPRDDREEEDRAGRRGRREGRRGSSGGGRSGGGRQ